jgi:hypothetical protein
MTEENKLRVTVSLGATMPFGDFGNVRPHIEISGIDPYGDVEQQINDGLATGVRAFARIDEELEVIITQLISPVAGKPGIRDRVERLENSLNTVKESNRKIIERLRDAGIIETTAAAVKGAMDGKGGKGDTD